MPLSSMVTGTIDGVSSRRPQQSDALGGGNNQKTEAERIAELEAKVAHLETTRNQLLAERRDVISRYEELLRESQRQPRRTAQPDDDGLLLRLARHLGIR